MRDLLILPTYNEAENLPIVLKRVRGLENAPDMLVVDDSSPDGTAEIARQWVEKDPGVHLMVRPAKSGLAGAYIEGFKWGFERDYEVVYQMDADLSHDPAMLPTFQQAIADGADVVQGSRYVPGGATPGWPLVRRVISRGGSFYARWILWLSPRDITGGFRAFRVEGLKRMDLDSLNASGYFYQIEMLFRASRCGLKIREVPIIFKDRELGVSKMSGGIFVEALFKVWGLRFSGWRPKRSQDAKGGD